MDFETTCSMHQKKRSRTYIPHLAEFYFKPSCDWTAEEAKSLYEQTITTIGPYQIDTVYYRDCIFGMTKIPDNSIDLVIADPPFGINFDGLSGAYNRDSSYVVENYQEVEDSYESFTRDWIHEVARVLKSTGSVYIFSGWTNLEAVLREARLADLKLLNHLIWHYPFGVYTRRKFVTSHYHILLLVKDFQKYFFNKIENYPQDVWILGRPYHQGRFKNSTKLPLELVQRCIDFSSQPGALVLDPFMGNGTTAVAAKGSWRHFLGFEINTQLETIIESELSQVKTGELHIPYSKRLPTIEELAQKYPHAFREYLRRNEEL